MATAGVKELFVVRSISAVVDFGLGVAAFLGLDVTSWRTGDPTRTYYYFIAEAVSTNEERRAEMAKALSVETAEGDWLTLRASDVFGIDRGEDTFSTPSITLHNAGGGEYPVDEPGEKTFKCTATGATFHNVGILSGTSPLRAGQTVVLQLVADTAGSAGTVGTNDVDDFVTPMNGVNIVSSTAAVGQDAQSDAQLRQACYDSRGALSLAGPADAYQSVATNTKLTGLPTGAITRAKASNDAIDGGVVVYVCDDDGDAAPADVLAVEAAIMKYANPLTATPGVQAADKVPIAVTINVHGDSIPADVEAKLYIGVTDSQGRRIGLIPFFSAQPIAGDTGSTLDLSQLIAEIHAGLRVLGVPRDGSSVTIVAPASTPTFVLGQVPSLDIATITEV